jgi:lipoate-protein ligase A
MILCLSSAQVDFADHSSIIPLIQTSSSRPANSQPNIETKGIASFRSPVTNLNLHLNSGAPKINHDRFVSALTAEFEKVYAGSSSSGSSSGSGSSQSDGKRMKMKTHHISEESIKSTSAAGYQKISEGIEEMKSWEWEYGASPEFSNSLEGEMSFGNIVSVSELSFCGLDGIALMENSLRR